MYTVVRLKVSNLLITPIKLVNNVIFWSEISKFVSDASAWVMNLCHADQ